MDSIDDEPDHVPDPIPGRDRKVTCQSCRATTTHEAVHHYAVPCDVYGPEHDVYDGAIVYLILRCRGCESASVAIEDASGASRDRYKKSGDWHYGGVPWVPQITAYPPRTARRQLHDNADAMVSITAVPPEVRKIHGEVLHALASGLPVLAGIGIRAIVESICKEKKSTGKNLKKRIDGLVPMGLVTKSNADHLHELRFLGNKAAHEVEAHQPSELDFAMDIVEHLMQAVYVLPARSQSRAKSKSRGNRQSM